MQKKKERKNACTQLWSNSKGFTFISMLISLTIVALTLPFIHYALSTLQLKQNYTEALSVQEFFIHLRDEIILSTSVHVANNQLYIRFTDLDDNVERTALFSQYNNSIRRQVNGQGHEIYLHQVADVVFEGHSNVILLTITGESGAVYEKTLYNYP